MGMSQTVKGDWRYLGSSDKPTKGFGECVCVHRLAIRARERERAGVSAEAELKSIFTLCSVVLAQGFDRDSRQADCSTTSFCFGRFKFELALDPLQ